MVQITTYVRGDGYSHLRELPSFSQFVTGLIGFVVPDYSNTTIMQVILLEINF